MNNSNTTIREALWAFMDGLDLQFVDEPLCRLLVGTEGMGYWVVASAHGKDEIVELAKSLASKVPEGGRMYVQVFTHPSREAKTLERINIV